MKSRIAAPALIAALALGLAAPPAGALTHEVSGSFQVQLVNSNLNNTPVTKDFAYHPEGLPADTQTATFVEQRVRLGYTAKADDALKLVTRFELDYSFYGDESYGVGANKGAAVGADQVNLETKNLYLDWTCPITGVNAKVGMQEFVDAYEGALLWADAAGISLARPFAGTNVALGLFRLIDDGDVPGDKTADFVALDLSRPFGEGAKAGFSYYLVRDDRADKTYTAHTVGVNGAATLGPASVHGYALYQFGDAGGPDISAFAANAGAGVKAGPGTARAEFCYASGDNDPDDGTVKSLQTFFNEYWYGSHGLAILTRDDYGLTADNGVVYDLALGGAGSMIASAAYDLPLGGKNTLSGTVGAAWAAQNPEGREGKALGTEVNLKFTRELHEGLTLIVRGAYAFLGSYFDGVAAEGKNPEDLFDARVILVYSF